MEEFLNDKNVRNLRIDFIERIVTIVIAGLGLIAVLAWDDALKHLFHEIFAEESTLVQEFLYAVVLTVLASLVAVGLGRAVIRKRHKAE